MAGEITPGDGSGDRTEAEIKAIPQLPHKRVCDEPADGFAACHARIRTDAYGAMAVTATPSGLGPSQLQSAYKLDATAGAGKVIAIVDAMDDPTAESDLGVYRSTFGLPACTTANGCFKKVNQNGAASPLPKADAGWSGEIALDLDMASAICPNCKIVLVEASSASMTDLGTSVNQAVKQGATVISNSYGGGESSSNASFDSSYFNHPGVAIFASSGDGGYGVEYPAASPDVIAVGGTSLAKSTTNARGWVESVWGSVNNANGGAGSGCSKFSAKPSWQKDAGCAKRTVADVSAVADPNTGVAVYQGGSWAVYGGTSAASPIVAATYALTGHGGDATVGAYAYNNTAKFFDVTSGANGSCGGSYLCTGGVGYDGPSGVGTPNATAMMTGGTGGGGGGGGGGTGGAGGGGGGGTGGAGGGGGGGTGGSGGGTGGSGGGGGGGTGGSGGGGGGTSSCTHSICSTGSRLVSGCDPCATQICAVDGYCCRWAWDNICVSEVSSVCGQTCQ
ncbi:MAG TPA: S53 family peptidase [Polyangia bacterium]